MAGEQVEDEGGGSEPDGEEEPSLPAAGVGQKAEGRAGVEDQGQVEVAGQDGKPLAETKALENQQFGELIGEHDHTGQDQPADQPGPFAASRSR
jgi:hypothetical protein